MVSIGEDSSQSSSLLSSHGCVLIAAFLLQIASKQAGYRGLTEYYQSMVCKEEKKIGEEISRLEVSFVRFQTKMFHVVSCGAHSSVPHGVGAISPENKQCTCFHS